MGEARHHDAPAGARRTSGGRARSRVRRGTVALVGALGLLLSLLASGRAAPPAAEAPQRPAGPAAAGASPSTTSPAVTTSTTSTTTTPPQEIAGSGVVTAPQSPRVLVNQRWRLPPGWVPPALAAPDVPFTFDGMDPKRLLRAHVADALEGLFAAAAGDGVPLLAISGYRGEAEQGRLFERAVRAHGQEVAARTTARPGHSEHQTGLAMDVTGADGRCPAERCFAETPEAAWLVAHAAEHGFTIRYPAGKGAVTGYDHEPWHLRHVGVTLATHLQEHDQTLEEWHACCA